MNSWIDTHCHLDAAEFHADAPAVRARARQAGVGRLVIPGVAVSNFQAVRELAHQGGDAYALGIHPLYVAQATDADLATLEDHSATGFVFGPFTDAAYQHALRRAFALYRQPAAWARVRQTGMRQPLGWASAAQAYRALYQQLLSH